MNNKNEPLVEGPEAGTPSTERDPKYTPGPWRPEKPSRVWQINSDAGPIALSVERRDLRKRPAPYHPAETEANAYLIAAAPDLLNALKRGHQKMVTYLGVYSGDKELRMLLDLWDTAITKAEGRPPNSPRPDNRGPAAEPSSPKTQGGEK